MSNISWNGLTASYDNISKTIEIPGGTDTHPQELTDPKQFWGNIDWIGKDDIEQIKFNGKFKFIGSVHALFRGLENLTNIEGLDNIDTSEVTDMSNMFDSCYSLTNLDLNHWNTSKVKNMSGMFWVCGDLTSIKLDTWDTSNVTDMSNMFNDCYNLPTVNVSNFNTSKVTDMNGMFSFCNNINGLDVSHWDTSQVTNMSNMFNILSISNGTVHRTKLTSLDVSQWNTSKVTDMTEMFSGCTELTTLDVSHFDTSQVTNMHGMFSYCAGLTSVDLSGFDTSKVTNMGGMFDGCKNLEKLDLSIFSMKNTPFFDQPAMGDADQAMFAMLSGLPKLEILVLGKDSDVKNAALEYWDELEGISSGQPPYSQWINLAGGTMVDAKGKNLWPPEEFMTKYKAEIDADTYIRSGNVTAHYQDEDGNELVADRDIRGLIGEKINPLNYQEVIPGYTLVTFWGDAYSDFD